MAETNNEAIPMGGSTADGTTVTTDVATAPPVSSPVYSAGTITTQGDPESPGKKNHAIVYVILALFALLIVAAIGLGALFVFATSDTMPKAPEVTGDMSTVVKDSALEMIKDKKISFDSNDINIFLGQLAESSKEKLAEEEIQINDLFAVISNDKATLYCRANYKGITWPIKATADVSYDDPYIVINLHSANLGKLNLPQDMIMERLEGVVAADNVSIHNGFIYYDTTDFNDQLSDLAMSELGLTPDDIDASEGTEEENQGFSIKKWFGNLVHGVKESVKNWASRMVSDFIHNIQFQDVKIIDNELVIKVTFEEKAPEAEVDTAA